MRPPSWAFKCKTARRFTAWLFTWRGANDGQEELVGRDGIKMDRLRRKMLYIAHAVGDAALPTDDSEPK